MPFVPPRRTLLLLDLLATRYGGSPFEWAEKSLGEVWFSLIAASVSIEEENRRAREQQARMKSYGKRR